MSRILTPIIGTVQPQSPAPINLANPIARGMTLCLNPANGLLLNSATSSINATTFGAAPTLGVGKYGKKIVSSAGGVSHNSGNLDSKTYTYLIVADLTSIDSPWGSILSVCNSGGTAQTFSMQRENTTTALSIYVNTTAYNLSVSGEISNIVGAGPVILAASNDNASTTTYFYRNGALIASGNGVGTPDTITSPKIVLFGERAASAAYGADGSIYLALGWNRVLTAAEHASIAANPWQIFAPQPRRIWVGPTTVSGTPILSAATAISIGSTQATPQCALTF